MLVASITNVYTPMKKYKFTTSALHNCRIIPQFMPSPHSKHPQKNKYPAFWADFYSSQIFPPGSFLFPKGRLGYKKRDWQFLLDSLFSKTAATYSSTFTQYHRRHWA